VRALKIVKTLRNKKNYKKPVKPKNLKTFRKNLGFITALPKRQIA